MVPRSGVRSPSTHSIVVVLPAPFGPIRPEDFPRLHVERDVVDGHGPAVGFPDRGNVNDRLTRHVGCWRAILSCAAGPAWLTVAWDGTLAPAVHYNPDNAGFRGQLASHL